jgi:hypothetical protein
MFTNKTSQMFRNFLNNLHTYGYSRIATNLAETATEQQVKSPNVVIDPGIQSDVKEAVDQLKKVDPNFFVGVSKIVGFTGGPFGQVQSNDPSVVHLNLAKIKQEIKRQFGSFNLNDPKQQQAYKEAIKRAIVEVISHETFHSKDWNPETHKFEHGEPGAEQFTTKTMKTTDGK